MCAARKIRGIIVYFQTDKKETEYDSCIRSRKWLLGESRALKVGINAG
jgi:hypothetical protein